MSCIYGLLPGLGTLSTPFAKVPGFGLDVETSMITAFKVLTAFAILSS